MSNLKMNNNDGKKERRKEVFYLNDALNTFSYGYIASDIWKWNTQKAREQTRFRHMGYSFWLAARIILYASSLRQMKLDVASIGYSFRLAAMIHLLFSFQPVFCTFCNKGCGVSYPVSGTVHIKHPLLLVGNDSPNSARRGFSSLVSGSEM